MLLFHPENTNEVQSNNIVKNLSKLRNISKDKNTYELKCLMIYQGIPIKRQEYITFLHISCWATKGSGISSICLVPNPFFKISFSNQNKHSTLNQEDLQSELNILTTCQPKFTSNRHSDTLLHPVFFVWLIHDPSNVLCFLYAIRFSCINCKSKSNGFINFDKSMQLNVYRYFKICKNIRQIYILVEQTISSNLFGNYDKFSQLNGSMNLNFKWPIILCKLTCQACKHYYKPLRVNYSASVLYLF